FEGLPVVGIEAQAAGLGCVFSDAVPAEVLLSSHAIQIPLSASNADWAAGLQRMLHQPCDRSAGAELIRQAGYDINIAAARLQQQYLQLGGQA
ncbi:MAG: glycosyltransferase family 1 protein, partial [Faecalibacterium prausnitzii]